MRLIDADVLENQFEISDEDILALDEIRHAPTVDAEVVVRCKDCKYADGKKETNVEKRYVADILVCRNSDLCGDEPLAMWPDDFCSYGKRKDDDNAT